MQQVTYEYPIRTIRLDLEDRPQTELEETGLALYRSLHIELEGLRTHWLKCQEHLEEQKKIVKECANTLLTMETEARRYGPVAGFPDPQVDLLPGEELTYKLKVADLLTLVNTYRDLAFKFNESNKELTEKYDEGMAMEDEFSDSFCVFDRQYFSPIIHDHERVQLDTCRFYDDFDEFRGCCGEVMEIFDKFMDEWKELGDEAAHLTGRLNVLNPHLKKIWDAFDTTKPPTEDPRALLN